MGLKAKYFFSLIIVLSTDGCIKRLEYPYKKAAEVDDEGQDVVQDTAMWLTQVTLVLPPNLAISESANVMFWDSASKKWSNEGIRDQEWNQGIHYILNNKIQVKFVSGP
jgi:hypothetical protein